MAGYRTVSADQQRAEDAECVVERVLPGRQQGAVQGAGAEQYTAGAGPHRQQNQQGVPQPHHEGAQTQHNSQGAKGTAVAIRCKYETQRKVGGGGAKVCVRWRGRRELVNSEILFGKDCGLGSVKNLTTSPC